MDVRKLIFQDGVNLSVPFVKKWLDYKFIECEPDQSGPQPPHPCIEGYS
jgi:hypothetical protein